MLRSRTTLLNYAKFVISYSDFGFSTYAFTTLMNSLFRMRICRPHRWKWSDSIFLSQSSFTYWAATFIDWFWRHETADFEKPRPIFTLSWSKVCMLYRRSTSFRGFGSEKIKCSVTIIMKFLCAESWIGPLGGLIDWSILLSYRQL